MIWPWVLSAVGVLGMWLVGKKIRAGWAVGLFSELLWLIYTVQSAQWGFLPAVLCYGYVFWKNWRSWKEVDSVFGP